MAEILRSRTSGGSSSSWEWLSVIKGAVCGGVGLIVALLVGELKIACLSSSNSRIRSSIVSSVAPMKLHLAQNRARISEFLPRNWVAR